MWDTFKNRWRQGYQTGTFPATEPRLPERFQGIPALRPAACPDGCRQCVEVCPTSAVLRPAGGGLQLDLGACLFCGKCEAACPHGAIHFRPQAYDMGCFSREALVLRGEEPVPARQSNRKLIRLCGNSLKIRQVSAGGCSACELDFNVLNTLAWDLGRFGIQVVASPRHADCLLVTGPVSRNMLLALRKTWLAVPEPRFLIACGACAISGGLFAGSAQTCGGLAGVEELPAPDLYVPGCPPHPATLLKALLRFIGREEGSRPG